MNFTDQLASTIHDVKNRMQLMLPHAELVAKSKDLTTSHAGEQLQLGLEELNQRLVGLLGLYKLETQEGIQCRDVYVADMLSASMDYLPEHFNVSLNCDDDFLGFFDENLVKSVISDAIHNASRFAKSQIQIVAEKQAKGIELRVEDDGPGFENELGSEGTGLGMKFARLVAAAHTNNGVQGAVTLGRSERLGGAKFSLYLP